MCSLLFRIDSRNCKSRKHDVLSSHLDTPLRSVPRLVAGTFMAPPAFPSLRGKVAIVTGGSRGIGRAVCLALAKQGCNVVVAAKSATVQPTLPGTIYTVADEIAALNTGATALPVILDLRSEQACIECVTKTVTRFGKVDILVNNASALWWHTVSETPTKKVRFFRFFTRKILLALYCVVRLPLGSRFTTSCEEFLIIPIYETISQLPIQSTDVFQKV